MHYIPSHTADFFKQKETFFKKTLKIRVATKEPLRAKTRSGSFPFMDILYFPPKSFFFLVSPPPSGLSPRITASKFLSASFCASFNRSGT